MTGKPSANRRTARLPLILALWCACAVAAETVVYVNNAAEGPEDGKTWNTAWRSIGKAVKDPRFANNGRGGCVIKVAAGKRPYREAVSLPPAASGSEVALNEITAKQGESPAIDAHGKGAAINITGSHVGLFGLAVRNAGGDAVRISSKAADIALNRCAIGPNRGAGVACRGRELSVQKCVIFSNSGGGIYLRKAGGMCLILYNTLHNNGSRPGKPQPSITLSRPRNGARIVIRNNIIIGPGAAIQGGRAPDTAIRADYNAHNQPYRFFLDKVRSWPWNSHDLGRRDKAAFDPRFVAPGKNDFRLCKDSPCRNASSTERNLGAR